MQSCGETESLIQRARSLLVVASTPPTDSYENFTAKVRDYNLMEPFKFTLPHIFLNNNFIKFVSIYAAYLYDSAMLYAWALDELLRNATRTHKH
ncbi:hypothetical protein DOY81_009238 [Sarcophaga bullata]|nr:hypothetical protein DOY81_009238 [Sarcophaga bullata]